MFCNTIRAKIITYAILKTINPVRFCVSDGQIIPGSNFAENLSLAQTKKDFTGQIFHYRFNYDYRSK